MLFRGLMVTALSGSLDGLVAAHNRGGPYFRNRATPTDPETARQINCRDAMQQLHDWWADELTETERQSWVPYAAAHPDSNRIGAVHTLSPWSMFCKQSFVRAQVIEQLGDSIHMHRLAPTDAPGLLGPATATLGVDNASLDVSWTNNYNWTGNDEAGILIYASQAIGPTINFFKGPYQLRDMILGDEEDPPVSPVNIPLGFTLAEGQKAFFRLRWTSNTAPTSSNWPGSVQRPF